jgi:hypothetical protein
VIRPSFHDSRSVYENSIIKKLHVGGFKGLLNDPAANGGSYEKLEQEHDTPAYWVAIL